MVVDNASWDRSVTLAQEAGARVVRQPIVGYGIAVRTGIQAARGHYIIMADGDGEHDLSALDSVVEQLENGFDFIVGNRFLRKGDSNPLTFQRYVGNKLLSGFLKLLYPVPIGDCNCGFRGFSAAAGQTLAPESRGFEAAFEMVIKAFRNNIEMTEVPVTQNFSHPERTSHIRPYRDGLRGLRLMISKYLYTR